MKNLLPKFLAFGCLFIFKVGAVFAQKHTLSGKVLGKNKVPVDFIAVILVKSNTNVVQRTVTNADGRFSIQAEKDVYVFQLEQLGKPLFKKEVLLDKDTDLGDIEVEEAILLSAVAINGQKKLIEKKIDRLVFNLSGSTAANGLNGFEALAMVPLVDVKDENTVKIVGKSQVSLMVDGRLMPLQGEEMVSYLRALRSDNIDKVEIITAPPAKYDALGNSGMINLILKKNTQDGWSGNVNNTYTQRKYGSDYANATVNFKSDQFGITGNFGYAYDKAKPYENFDIRNDHHDLLLTQKTNRIDVKNDYNVSINTVYKFNAISGLWLTYDYLPRKTNYDILSSAFYPARGATPDSSLLTRITRERKINSHVASLTYELGLGARDSGKKLSLSSNYLNNSRQEPNAFEVLDAPSGNYTRTINDVKYKIWSGQLDFTLPFKALGLETGLKYTNISNNLFQDFTAGFISNPGADRFKYQEDLYAFYLSSTKKINAHLDVKAGIRYENSQVNLFLTDQTRKRAGTFFPSFYLTYTTGTKAVFSLNYTKRISRPDFQSLNPYKLYTNTNNYTVGNPQLNPSVNHNVELSFSKDNLTVSTYLQHTRNGYASIFGLDNDYNNYIAIDNFFNRNNVGVYATYYRSLTSWWQSQVSANYYYQESKSFNPQFLSQRGTTLYYNIQNSIFLNKEKTFRMNVAFWHSLPKEDTNVHWKGSSNLSTTLSLFALKKTLQMSLAMFDILRTNRSGGEMYNENYLRSFRNYYDAQKIALSINYSFGNKNIRENRKKGNFEENQRAN